MHPGETIESGGSPTCDKCGVTPELKVCRSAAGYYLGTWCRCGPYSRESGYYATHAEAQAELDSDRWERKSSAYKPGGLRVEVLDVFASNEEEG